MRNIDLNGLRCSPSSTVSNLATEQVGGKRYTFAPNQHDRFPFRQIRVMFQGLLASRFKLAVHRELNKTSVFELTVAKGGPKLPPNQVDQLPASYARENLPRVVDGGYSSRILQGADSRSS